MSDAPPIVPPPPPPAPTPSPAPTAPREAHVERLLSLDVFRGVAIGGMILVNNPGDAYRCYAPLKHALWKGCTLADLVFPFFIFIVGVAITLSLGRRRQTEDERDTTRRIVRRVLILFALGVLLQNFPLYEPRLLRIPGILQRIAVVYGAAALLALRTRTRTQVLVTGAILAGYWALLMLVPTPGYGPGDLAPDANLGAWLDRTLLGRHVYNPERIAEPRWDPEGILSTLPAVATALSGVLAGRWLTDARRSGGARTLGLLGAGAAVAATGLALSPFFMISKNLWTSTYVLLTSGLALAVLGVCYWVVDVRGWRRWAAPLVVLGVNPLAAFVLSSFVARVLVYAWTVPGPDGRPIPAKAWLYAHTFARGGSTPTTSLAFAVAYLAVWIGVLALLHRRRIHFKV